MEMVEGTRQTGRRNHMGSRDNLRQSLNDRIHGGTLAFYIFAYNLTGYQGNIFGFQIEITKQPLINFLHFQRPVLLSRIRFTLMEENTPDDTLPLGLFSQFNQTAIWIIIVFLSHIL